MRFKQYFYEGINDKNIFKAVFLAGGPGSGKSFISNEMFKGTGTKVINSDDIFEKALKKNNISFKIDPSKKELFAKQMEFREKAKFLTAKKQNLFVNGMLPIIIDGTGKDLDKITKKKRALENMGYDTFLVFVNTTLDVAIDRNTKRARSVPPKIVEKGWNAVQNNLGGFQSEFGKNFLIVDNSKVLDKEEIRNLGIKLRRSAMKFLDKPLENNKGLTTIDFLKRTKGKLMSDLPADFFK